MMRKLIKEGKKTVVLTAAASAVLGFGAMAYAGWGEGSGHYNHGYGNQGGNGIPAQQHMNMSEEDYKVAREASDKFLAETEEIRRDLMEKEARLRAGVAAEAPDLEAMRALQQEISVLQGQLEEKRLAHILEMKDKIPGFNGVCPYAGAHGAGYGHGIGHRGGHGAGQGMMHGAGQGMMNGAGQGMMHNGGQGTMNGMDHRNGGMRHHNGE